MVLDNVIEVPDPPVPNASFNKAPFNVVVIADVSSPPPIVTGKQIL